jgi:threo-3-hydroxy-D-aspartate ammonia-lyase
MHLQDLPTPAALVETQRMAHNIARMQTRMDALGVAFRPHVKTSKCVEITRAQVAAGARGITVSTLKEAEQFFAAGISDILYAVGMAAPKLRQAAALMAQGCALKIITDSVEGARAIAQFGQDNGVRFEVWIEIDCDGHRSGVLPESDTLIAIGQLLHGDGLRSCSLSTPEALEAMAEQERSRCVRAAQRLRATGLPCANVSVGSTPTALSAQRLDGVTEVRAGVYVFFDLVMANVGVCGTQDIALSVLTTVIGHQKDKGWAIVDAGWMAMSRDRGTQAQQHDYGYGQVCDLHGTPLAGYLMTGANQEHGIVSFVLAAGAASTSAALPISQRFPVGTPLRILPNHACATGAQFAQYHAVTGQEAGPAWSRFHGW